jgi:hypothetical protein
MEDDNILNLSKEFQKKYSLTDLAQESLYKMLRDNFEKVEAPLPEINSNPTEVSQSQAVSEHQPFTSFQPVKQQDTPEPELTDIKLQEDSGDFDSDSCEVVSDVDHLNESVRNAIV